MNQQSAFRKLDLCRAPVGRQGCTSVINGKHPCCGPALCLFSMHCVPQCSRQVSAAMVVLVSTSQTRKWVIKPLIQVASKPSRHSLCSPLLTAIQSASWFVWFVFNPQKQKSQEQHLKLQIPNSSKFINMSLDLESRTVFSPQTKLEASITWLDRERIHFSTSPSF